MTVPEIMPRIWRFYESKPENMSGGFLHIVLDDDNVETVNVQWCKDQALLAGDTEAAEIADLLLGMSLTQRRKVCARVYQKDRPYGWWEDPPQTKLVCSNQACKWDWRKSTAALGVCPMCESEMLIANL